VVPSQQPLQSVALHDPTLLPHACRVGSQNWNPSAWQLWHFSPSAPHWVMDAPVWQVPVGSQHPDGQVVALQAPPSGGRASLPSTLPSAPSTR
jgi:hypothetical protein